MLDENLPTYRFTTNPDTPLNTVLYFTHNGSESTAEYLLKRPDAGSSRNQYALGLFDAKYGSVIYAEVLIKPEWSQPTLSAAEIRAQGGTPEPVPLTPDAFSISLYNPDQAVAVKRHQGSWGKSDSWEFEIPERSFKVPSASRIDQEGGVAPVSDHTPKVVFRWKRDGRKDMVCYMVGRSVGGKKSKEPDITVALFRGGKNDSSVQIYEPNMRRVEIEDRKGLEVAFLLSAEVIRDLYVVPRQDVFNAAGGPAPTSSAANNGRRTNTGVAGPSPAFAMSGALNNAPPASSQNPPSRASPPRDARKQADIDAETKRLQAMVAEEERQARERDEAEAKRIKKMLEKEEADRRRRDAEIDQETERLRREYGVGPPGGSSSPPLPPRPSAGGGWFGPPVQQPQRPNSVGPSASGAMPYFEAPPGPPPQQGGPSGGQKKHGNPLSNLLHRSEDKKKVQRKRSVHF